MATPRRREERDDLLWNPALPSAAVPHSRVAQAPIPPNPYDPPPPVLDPFAGPPARMQPPTPAMQAPVPALSADIVKGAKEPGPPKPSGETPGYESDFLDVLSAGLRGFGGQHGPSMREQRWNQEQDRNQQAEKDAYEAWLGQRRAEHQDAVEARWEEQDANRVRALDQGDERITIAEKKQTGIDADRNKRNDPNDPHAKAMREFLVARGANPAHVADLDNQQLQSAMTMFNRDDERRTAPQDTAIAANRAGATATASTTARETAARPFDVDKESRAELRAQRAAELANERLAKSQFPQQANQYAQDTKNDLTILGLVQDFDRRNPEGKPIEGTGIVQGRIVPDELASENALENRSLMKLISEKWSRSQSGAAIGMSEGEKLDLQAGTKETATDDQIRIAMRSLRTAITRYAKARAVGQEDAAAEVARAYGVDLGLGARKTRGAQPARGSTPRARRVAAGGPTPGDAEPTPALGNRVKWR